MKTYLTLVLYLSMCGLGYTQNINYTIFDETIKNVNGEIVFPIFNSETNFHTRINNTLSKYLDSSFYLKDSSMSLNEKLNYLNTIGLDTLNYLNVESDTTISIALTVVFNQGKQKFGWSDFFTFSKITGETLTLEEVILGKDAYNRAFCGAFITLIETHITNISGELRSKRNMGLIGDEEFNTLLCGINKYHYSHLYNDFLVSGDTIILKNGVLIPDELKGYIPEFFRFSKKEFITRMNSYYN